jgi:hypothetical protein
MELPIKKNKNNNLFLLLEIVILSISCLFSQWLFIRCPCPCVIFRYNFINRFVSNGSTKNAPPLENERFDKILAADVVEHIEKPVLEKIFEKISTELLAEQGVFIGHTAPNLLEYDIAYEMKRREAKRLGLYMPKNPRSAYEDLMHINEQTEILLNATLKRFFKYVYTWLPLDGDCLGTLRKDTHMLGSIQSHDIYFLTSNAPIETAKVFALTEQYELGEIKTGEVRLTSLTQEIFAEPGQILDLTILLENKSSFRFKSTAPYPIHIGYHLYEHGEVLVYDGMRTALPYTIMPGTSCEIACSIKSPAKPGQYILCMTLVQEGNFWFEDRIPDITLNMPLYCGTKQ